MAKKKKYLAMISIATAVIGSALTGQLFKTGDTNGRVEAQDFYGDPATYEFISIIGERARQIGQERGIYASVMIAQAIHESNSGRSGLSIGPYYNLFGIKGQYQGNSVTMRTWEDDGTGRAYYINDAFRAYPSWAASMYDYADLLSWDYYAGVRKAYAPNYWDATAALTGTYATDTSYAAKINAIIEFYGLTAYDTPLGYETVTLPVQDSVWNAFRGSYTTSQILAEDQAWNQYVNGYYGR
ncbi:flagellum-specific peptidoglycan hydrolase FlgJ [Streptococcus rupicaprae]|uniref:Flagellum-specific peptidoglycan hydrolase FlgJ n=1 Tax=Streptococcus rupicaprae TaxID=759619 RepID=A0ABV2FGY9_9STRE